MSFARVVAIAALAIWSPAALHEAINGFAAAKGISLGKLAQPIRLAVCGGTVSPPIDATLAILGKDEALARPHHVREERAFPREDARHVCPDRSRERDHDCEEGEGLQPAGGGHVRCDFLKLLGAQHRIREVDEREHCQHETDDGVEHGALQALACADEQIEQREHRERQDDEADLEPNHGSFPPIRSL